MLRLLIEFAVKKLVLNPSKVYISETIDGPRSIIEIRVHPDDVGKVIGKEGRSIKALRVLAESVATSHGMESILDVLGS
ncbi:KH domain-containing protein [bacterium]|jgi:uncharacterized protein|nr:KH domain-containing protein [bacterium]